MQYLPIVPEHRFTKNIPYGMFLYHKDKIADSENLITFFIVNNDLDIDDLLQYKQQSYTHLLIAIQNQQSFYDLSFADNIIYCKEKDNDIMMRGIEIMLFQLDDALFNMDFTDIKFAFSQGKHVYFYHYYSDNLIKILENLSSIINKNMPKTMILSLVLSDGCTFDDFQFFVNKINSHLNIDSNKFVIQVNYVKEFDDWKVNQVSCWVGIFLMFNEKIPHFT